LSHGVGPVLRVPSRTLQDRWSPQQLWTLLQRIDAALLDTPLRA
jgi:hypothetical protein